ncbi:CAP domain-containing protein [Nonomuraea cavernae]|uniref:SCP domain-containing protein n=1 Tax=Nonomuraea cavernae TaxID=2045107 RepID=A0A917YRI7_9ACTN|nr:CAP domain-containing protein [Nonomuraea cavernae]MCA2183739.1 CAP domain-containing protein [Nonomuraea cavernae]GGO61219.1 hypothetical protein GCM10012289_02930 [Nonomuraea cavernae]
MALGMPVASANAATEAQAAACGVKVAKPALTADGRIRASASRSGCDSTALVRIRVKRAQAGTDPVIKSGARRTTGGKVTVTLPCTPGVYYAVVTDYRGNTGKSRATRLTCAPSTPTPTASPTSSATPKPTPTATSSSTPKPSATATPPAGTVGTAEENEVVRLTNVERAKGGCQPLKHDAQLRQAAFGHSSDMATQNYLSHTSKDGRTFMDRIRGAGFTGGSGWAENIAMGQSTPAAVMTSWMNSSGHKANIMNCKYTLIGVGAAKNSKGQIYWTQNFAAK